MTASQPRHYAPWYRQFAIDVRPWLVGIVVTVLCAAVVTLAGLLLAASGAPILGSMILLVGLMTVTLCSCFWAAGKVTGEMGIPS